MREDPRPMRAAIAPPVSNPRHDTYVGRVAHLSEGCTAPVRWGQDRPGRGIFVRILCSWSGGFSGEVIESRTRAKGRARMIGKRVGKEMGPADGKPGGVL